MENIDYQLVVVKAMAEKIERLESEIRKLHDYCDILNRDIEERRICVKMDSISNPDDKAMEE